MLNVQPELWCVAQRCGEFYGHGSGERFLVMDYAVLRSWTHFGPALGLCASVGFLRRCWRRIPATEVDGHTVWKAERSLNGSQKSRSEVAGSLNIAPLLVRCSSSCCDVSWLFCG